MGTGRPPFKPTPEQQTIVRVLRAHGIALRVIAKAVGIDVATLRLRFRDELRDAQVNVEAAMGLAIVRAARSGAWGAAKYWLMVHGDARWRVAERHLIGGDANAAPVRVPLNLHMMTDAELAAELESIRARRAISATASRD